MREFGSGVGGAGSRSFITSVPSWAIFQFKFWLISLLAMFKSVGEIGGRGIGGGRAGFLVGVGGNGRNLVAVDGRLLGGGSIVVC